MALSVDTPSSFLDGENGSIPAAAATTVYEGSAVGDNGSGYGRGLVAGDKFKGFCLIQCDNSGGSAGDEDVQLRRKGRIRLSVTGASISTNDSPVYASDSGTYTLTKGSNSKIGRQVGWDAVNSKAVVEFGPAEAAILNNDELEADTCDTVNSADKNAVFGTTDTTDATAGAVTYTAAEMLGGIIHRDPAGGARSDVTPTAEDLVAAMDNPQVGDTFFVVIRNDADAAETITVTAGTGFTLDGTMTIAQNNSKLFMCRLTNVTASSEAATLYSVGTLVH